MSYLDANKFLQEINVSLNLIDKDISKPGTISNIIDRRNRSMLILLKSIVKMSTVQFVNEEINKQKEQIYRLKTEIIRINKRIRIK